MGNRQNNNDLKGLGSYPKINTSAHQIIGSHGCGFWLYAGFCLDEMNIKLVKK